MEQTELAALLEQLRRYTVPELCDGCTPFHTMDAAIKPYLPQNKIIGPAFTVDVPAGVSGIVPDAIMALQPGQVLVISGKGHCASSYWGDHRSLCAQLLGAEGVVIDGAFRDLEGCREAGLPIFARGLTPGSAKKTMEGQLNVPVLCGGVTVNPGDIIVGDCNGVLVLAPETILAVLEKTRRKVAAQAYTIQRMRELGRPIPRIIYPDAPQDKEYFL